MEVVSAQDTDPLVGCKLEYINPTNGQGALSTISTFLQFTCLQALHPVLIAPQRVWCSVLLKASKVVIEHQANNLKYTVEGHICHPVLGQAAMGDHFINVLFCASDKVLRRDLLRRTGSLYG